MSRPPTDHAALIEDLEWMADTGESLDGAAERLNTTPVALERALYRHGRHDLATTLKQRNPLNPHLYDHLRRKDHAA